MAVATVARLSARNWLAGALTVTLREMRDTMRDWRIVAPIVVLTLIFPVIMNFTAGAAQDFVRQYGASLIGERFIPFLLMIVGFFPISFSLVVALETFVGERERKSIEALLCTPLTNGQLYLGKMLAAMLPPLGAAYLGISVYLTALYIFRGWTAPAQLLVQIVLLTTFEAVVMVSGAVVVSSQTTSSRAANLLASFIIVPMAMLVQAESVIMFWGRYDVLWGFVALLIVVDLILIRMGVKLFDREELLGREFDTISLKERWRTFVRYFKFGPDADPAGRFSLRRVYRQDVPRIIGRARYAAWAVLAATAIGIAAGLILGLTQPIEFHLGAAGGDAAEVPFGFILLNNLRTVVLSGLIGIFTLGVVPAVVPLINSGLVAFVVTNAAAVGGHNPLILIAAGILPHGLFELTAVWLASILALRLGAAVISRQPRMTLGDSWLLALADYAKVLVFVVVPLLVIAAVVEANITPSLLAAALGR
ncbi:MAG TPA: stage II sporulation protein M [Anaerolineae bacterium]